MLMACGGPSDELEQGGDTVTVRPRVVIDGLIELSARTEGRLFVDEVVFHAPTVELRSAQAPAADLLATDPVDDSALFFHYDLENPEGAGHAIGGERRWELGTSAADARVVFGFSPLHASRGELDEIHAVSGYDLSPLDGYTAYVHGYVIVEDANVATTLSAQASGDPEGAPGEADPSASAGDPEGAPGEVAAGDPEGAPGATDEQSAGDPEGAPGDPGEESSGDPEGAPGDPGEETSGERQGDPMQANSMRTAVGGNARLGDDSLRAPGEGQLVPFLVVISSPLELSASLAELRFEDRDRDGWLPIDLHIDANALFDDDRLHDLDDETDRVIEGRTHSVVMSMDATEAMSLFDVDAGQSREPAAESAEDSVERSATESSIQIERDSRDDR
jgi:hypothetical protein